MKITKIKKEFEPVSITLEDLSELKMFLTILRAARDKLANPCSGVQYRDYFVVQISGVIQELERLANE